MSKLLLMCVEFFKTGLFSVGGGLATLPFLTKIAEKHPDWFTFEDLGNMVAVAESTPGPIGVNISTFAGFKTFGIPGALLSTLSLVLPSFIIILLAYKFWQRYKNEPRLERAFAAARPGAMGMIGAAAITMLKTSVWPSGIFNWHCLVLLLAFLALMMLPKLEKVHPIVYILVAAVIGLVVPL